MDIKMNAKVECMDKPTGHVSRVILDPIKNELTDIVVKYRGEEYEVRVSHIISADDDLVEITLTSDTLLKQPTFTETQYIRSPIEHEGFVDMTGLYYSPYVTMEMVSVQRKHISLGEVDFTRNTPVLTKEGRIGKIDELVVNPTNYHITHIVLREGHLWGQRDVVIGVEHITDVDEDGVHLKMTKAQVEALPALAVKRHFDKMLPQFP